ncbi:uncharacterized protein I303_105362 [Kwoniella dejecticola CBS 10117]|uniref:rRNA-processing protein EFG1 n=1 Tax=Kwoniella dejecticola CBS 10117 TaxID=1296121 RepID=A0A1A6A2Q5_9TREE|nr:uncharacterized protein I303_05192 [Kwoniella dejecticola CBS 10117]OBR84334.1 hypothetical protein I303_05192 [Kwoniella dejecticola CBS 10117]
MPVDKKHGKARSSPYKKPKPTTSPDEAGPSRPRPSHKIPTTEQRSTDALPGLSKLKGQIRQTKRLLAKDTLEPGLRVQTQRRLTSLEADLANALKRDVEKKNGAKYHMVKFFERQKLVRIIKRIQKKLKSSSEISDKKRAKLEEELEDARVMMNYVLNFPNTEKYISLFPPSASSSSEQRTEEEAEQEEKAKLKLPPLIHPTPTEKQLKEEYDKPSKRRHEILLEISQLMKDGKLSNTPEEEIKKEKNISLLSHERSATKGDKKVDEVAEEEDDFFESDE